MASLDDLLDQLAAEVNLEEKQSATLGFNPLDELVATAVGPPSPAPTADQAEMADKAVKSAEIRRAHADFRRQIAEKQYDFASAILAATFMSELQTLRVERVLTAIPRINRTKALQILALARIPVTRKLGWLSTQPLAQKRIQELLDQYLRQPQARQLPNPNWPWRD